ncbi:ABC transporter permease [Streptomyces nanshensis]|uniref:ABC transporter permease n=1 Tax=Streptomyces nanshensis TaxID=518642 RepID=A0A1E7L8J5_9ACTN|nr:ABC transporter permease [Streptomyces nanshensis]
MRRTAVVRRAARACGPLLLALPLAVAMFGPYAASWAASPDGAPYATGAGHPLGTDGMGRDVLTLLLRGGRSALGAALGAVALAYLAGAPLGLAAAVTRHRWLEELLLRPVEVVQPVPSLLVISVTAVWWRGQPLAIALAVALVNVPAVARLVRAAALDAASSPVVEAMRQQGESRLRILAGYVGRSVVPVVTADAGTRVAGAVFTVAAANFLGLGLEPTAPDWAVTIAASREALLVQPLAVCAPAALLVMFTVGLNLVADRLVRRTRQRPPAARESHRIRTDAARSGGGAR